MKRGRMPVIFGVSFLLNIVAAGLFAVFIGPKPGLLRAVEAGAAIGFGLVATSFWISYLFARRSLMLALIDGGYMTLRFIVYGWSSPSSARYGPAPGGGPGSRWVHYFGGVGCGGVAGAGGVPSVGAMVASGGSPWAFMQSLVNWSRLRSAASL
jgi:hypothetical protein